MTWSEYADERNAKAIDALLADQRLAKDTVAKREKESRDLGHVSVAHSTPPEVSQPPEAPQAPPTC